MSAHGGRRPGAGRKPVPEDQRKIGVSYKLAPDVVEILRAGPIPATQMVERAVRAIYGPGKAGDKPRWAK